MDSALDVKQIVQFIAWDRVPYALLVLGFGWLLLVLSGRALDDMSERFTERRLLLLKTKAFTRFFLYALIGILVGSSVLDVENEALLAVLGTIGLAIGFAVSNLGLGTGSGSRRGMAFGRFRI